MLLGFSSVSPRIKAQHYYSIQYSISIPTNDLRDYISKTSFKGITFEYFTKITSEFAAGVTVGWNGFYERMTYATYTDGTASTSGIQYRYSNAAPFHLSGLYFFGSENKVSPYVGLGIGAIYTVRTTDMGLFRWEEDTWNFSVRPEAGLVYNFRYYSGFKLSIRYNEAFRTSEMDDQSFLSVNVGLVFRQ